MQYDAFISYSHAADGQLAPALQAGLHRLARPWYRMRALRVFRDATSMAASPSLWASIERSLESSRHFILMASPHAAASPWVAREVHWWLEHRGAEQFLIVLTEGDIDWCMDLRDFDPRKTTALPEVLFGRFQEVPLHVDLRWARGDDMLSLRHARFRSAVLDLAAPLHGRPKDLLDGEDVRQHRRSRRVAALAAAGLVSLTAISVWSTQQARQQRDLAVSRQLAATASALLDRDPELAVLLAIEGVRTHSSTQAEAVLRRALTEIPLGTPLHGHRGSIHALALDSAGNRLLTGSADKTAKIWNLDTGSVQTELAGHQHTIDQAAFSPDGSLVLTVSARDQDVRIWRAGGELLLQAPGHRAHWLADGQKMLVAGADARARLWDIHHGQPVIKLDGHSDWIHDLASSPDGLHAVTASRDATARIWELASGRALKILEGHQGAAVLVVISPDGTRVATFDATGAGRVWTLPEGKLVAQLDGHTERVVQAAWSGHGDMVATASEDFTARIWDADTGHSIHTLSSHVDHVVAVAWSPDDSLLMTGSLDGTARAWGSGGRSVGVLRGHGAPVTQLVFARDGNTVYAAGLSELIRKWMLPRGWRPVELRGHQGRAVAAAIAADGRRVLTVDVAGTLRHWDPASGYPLQVLHTGGFMAVVSPSPTGDRVIVAPRSETAATVYAVATGLSQGQFTDHSEPITCAAWDATASRAITASWDGSARVWDVASGRSLARFPVHGRVRACPSLSPDGTLALIAGADGVARLWRVEGGKLVAQMPEHTSGLNHMAWSADGARIVTSGHDYFARVREAHTGRVLKTIRMGSQQGHAHLSADGRRLLAPGPQTWVVWDLDDETAAPVPLPDAPATANIASWSPDGAAVVTTNVDGQVVIHPWVLFAQLSELIDYACKRVTANLTESEWRQHIGPSVYRRTCPDRPVLQWPHTRR